MKENKHNMFDVKLDDYEQETSDAVDAALEKCALKSVTNVAEELAFAKEAASNFLRKDQRVNIRISGVDLARLKQKAAYKGLPYQTFISAILHEYAAGHFVEI